MLAFSTSWNSDGRFTARALLASVREFGFGAIELCHSHSADDVDEIIRVCRESGVRITSVHNYCPRPAQVARGRSRVEPFLLSSLNESERRRAVDCSRRSIETAASAGAAALIVHLGRVEMPSGTGRLADLYVQGRKRTGRYRRARDSLVRARSKRARRYFERALMSLEDLCKDAMDLNVALCVENRYYFREIPTLEEMIEINKRFEGAPVAYWHDIGHAQVMENLDFWSHEDFLDVSPGRVAGFHVHDVLLCEDHRPPFSGMVDFTRFRRYWKPEVVRVVECSPIHPRSRVEWGVRTFARKYS